ncbi:hypothetical protein [Bacillus sp. 166amftsu]|uniref:hypothetical protein n=1 Tax=Bacillus sp. 166amftsu TaxID=1761753 RepID=UPI00089A8DCE|nr:hypothetical protein [Bacillus sp. 166amftsu]SDZ37818.1 3-hydroxymyristoyl/3-hydroxydecanoyl-(acyl carrier protein) dehydratase [Bacillus sp. 166amftsu]
MNREVDKYLELLPHRSPFRFVDKIVNYDSGKSLTTIFSSTNIYNLSEIPITVLIESVAQTAVLLTQLETEPLNAKEFPLLGSIDSTIEEEHFEMGDDFIIKVGILKLLSKKAVLVGEVYNSSYAKILTASITVAVSIKEEEG